jgi:hypothetical protein
MDPLTALSVAASGVQFVDYATRLLSDTVETYKSATGQTERALVLEQITRQLDALTSRVEEKRSQLREGAPGGTPDASFLEACRQCQEISQELTGILQTLVAKQWPKSKLKSAQASLAAAIRGLVSASKIKDLRAKLQTVQQQMQMAALVSLWYVCTNPGYCTLETTRLILVATD